MMITSYWLSSRALCMGYWPSVRSRWLVIGCFLHVYRLRQSQGPVNTQKRRPISSHLDRKSLVNKGFIIWLSGKFFLQDAADSPERARSSCHSGSQSQCRIWGFGHYMYMGLNGSCKLTAFKNTHKKHGFWPFPGKRYRCRPSNMYMTNERTMKEPIRIPGLTSTLHVPCHVIINT